MTLLQRIAASLPAFTQWLKDWGLNAEKGDALWLLSFGVPCLLSGILAPEYTMQAVAIGGGGYAVARAVWLLWVNPPKRQAKRQCATERYLAAHRELCGECEPEATE